MKNYLFLAAAGLFLAASSPAVADPATGVSRDTLTANGATSYPGCDCFLYNGQVYMRNGAGGTYTVASGDSVTVPAGQTPAGGAQTVSVTPRASADVHEDDKRDYRLTCPLLKKTGGVDRDKCRQYLEVPH